MPPNLTRVTVDLEGRVRDYCTGRTKNARPVGEPVDVEVNETQVGHNRKTYAEDVHEAVRRAYTRRKSLHRATAYSVGKRGPVSYHSVYVHNVPVQFYRWGR